MSNKILERDYILTRESANITLYFDGVQWTSIKGTARLYTLPYAKQLAKKHGGIVTKRIHNMSDIMPMLQKIAKKVF